MADYKNFERVLRNVDKLNSRALVMKPENSAREMLQYLQGEGYTIDRFLKASKNYADAQGLEADYGFIKAGIQGLSLGFGDEFEAGIKTLLNKKPYEQNLGAIQFAKQEFEAERPIASALTEVGGSLPTAILGGEGTALALAKAAPRLCKAGAAVSPSMRALGTTTAGGTISGGIVGAGQAEEGGRLQGAKTGAQLGLLLSPAALYGSKVVGSALTKTADVTGITDATQKDAINTLVVGLKTDGLWTKMQSIYPFVGGSASSHKFNLKDPRDLDAAFRLEFLGTWTHSSTGAKPNGTSGYARSYFAPNPNQNVNSNGMGMYITQYTVAQSDPVQMGTFDGVTQSSAIIVTPTNYVSRLNGGIISIAITGGAGSFDIQRTSSTLTTHYKNGVSVTTGNSGGTLSPQSRGIFLGNLNTGGVEVVPF